MAQSLRGQLAAGLARATKAVTKTIRPNRWQLTPRTEVAAVALVAAVIGAANLRWRAETAEVAAMSHELEQVHQAISTAQGDVEELQGLNDQLRALTAETVLAAIPESVPIVPAAPEQEPALNSTLPISVRRQRRVAERDGYPTPKKSAELVFRPAQL